MRRHLAMIALTLAVFLAAHLALLLVRALGGFTTAMTYSLGFVASAGFGRNLEGLFFGMLHFAGADIFGRPVARFATLLALIRLAGLGALGCAVVAALRRSKGGWDLRFVLACAVLADLASCALSVPFNVALGPSALDGGSALRYLTPAILFGGVLVALECPEWVRRRENRRARIAAASLGLLVVAVATGGFLAQTARRWPEKPRIAQSSAAKVGHWLRRHGLTRGVAPYWTAPVLTVATGGRVTVRAVTARGGRLHPFRLNGDEDWRIDGDPPQFAVYHRGNGFGVTARSIRATYPYPSKTYEECGYRIVVFHTGPAR